VACDPKDGTEEIRRLQVCINDLISLQTLPAIWDGRESGSIVSTLLDVLVTILQLDFAYLRLNDSINGSPVEILQLAQRRAPPTQALEMGRVLDRWLTNEFVNAPLVVPNPAGDGEVNIAPFRLGLMDQIGVLVASSKRASFPTPTETLLLRMAANQALAALQEARQLHEQKRAAEELERRVADRTAQLTAANEALRESEKKYRMLFDSIDEGFCTIEVLFDENDNPIDYRFLEVNPSFEKQTGIQNARGRRMREIAPQHEDHWFEIYGRIALTGEPVRFENQAAQLHRWYDAYAFRVGEPADRRVAILFDDITERKQAEAKLLLNEAYLSEGQRLSRTGSFGWSVVSGEIYWSEETYDIFEHDRSVKPTLELVFERVHPDDREPVQQAFDRATKEKTDFDIEHRLQMPDGRVKHLHVIARASDTSSDNFEFVGAVTDVTAATKAEEALRQAQADLAHVSRLSTMGELTASIAHEVNQPLTAVVNNANASISLLPKGAPNLEEVREALAEIIEDANRASDVIARVRQLAKRAPIEKSLLDLRGVVQDVLTLARYESAARKVTIRTDLSKDLLSVSGDRVQLQQVLLNLVMNAMDAMNEVEESKRVLTICGWRETHDGTFEARLRVSDSGVGFKPEEMDRLFEAFYTTKRHGMGMGLAISRSIIEAHGGRLWAEPNAGPGATFLLSLPGVGNAVS